MGKAWKIIQNIESDFFESKKNSEAKKQSAVNIIFSMPREIFDNHALIIAKYDEIVCHTNLIKVTSGQSSFMPGKLPSQNMGQCKFFIMSTEFDKNISD